MTPILVLRWTLASSLLFAAACKDAVPEAPSQAATGDAGPAAASQFNPLLRSEALKDAIHRALTTGQNQRWEDGGLSGYAVPSLTTLANGCRTIRYTVDQQPDAPMMTINACEGTR